MKKTFLFSLGLVVAFASLFISCSEDETISDSKEKVLTFHGMLGGIKI